MNEVLESLRVGECVLLATDTVYGLAAMPSTLGYMRIFELKRRDAQQVLPWLVGSVGDLDRYGEDVPVYARKLAEAFWPGGLTLVVRASSEARALGSVADDGTVALRMPDEPFALKLLGELSAPVACTSANLHGLPAPQHLADVDPSMRELACDAGIPSSCKGGTASTIVDCTQPASPRIIRHGALSDEAIQACLDS